MIVKERDAQEKEVVLHSESGILGSIDGY